MGIDFFLTENLFLFADSPADHVALSTILTINKCSNRECVDITIQDDLVLEQRESFRVMLEKPPGFDEERIKLGIVEKEVTIVEDDGEWDRVYILCILSHCTHTELKKLVSHRLSLICHSHRRFLVIQKYSYRLQATFRLVFIYFWLISG